MIKKRYLIALAAVAMLAACGSHKNIIDPKPKVDIGKNVPPETENPIGASKREYTRRNSNWGVEYTGEPWVKNMSKPVEISNGLYNRHLSVTPSHGRYYDRGKGRWKWQRPELFCTTEDLFTQTIVIPYLIPMLENAGATVFTSRERDWQRNEVIIDNDDRQSQYYHETNNHRSWKDAGVRGFAQRNGTYINGENPFDDGTVRMAQTANQKNKSYITYMPNIRKEGKYAVYVSYATLSNSVDDAEYIVYHKGSKTVFHVNQKMGGGTWVYLGTFAFGEGCSQRNCLVVTNVSDKNGVVTSDAVRFGGGTGLIQREGKTSGLPRCLEGSRYNAQWSGAPQWVYNAKEGQDDYTDDINTRSRMTNWMAGGSCYVPNMEGLKVPLELSLAVHSDAGYHNDCSSVYGTLSICTTDFHDGVLNAGISRNHSKTFATSLLYDSQRDLSYAFGSWTARKLYDRNYSESRLPEVPSAILETLSHQSFPDMKYGQDPNFRFTLARSIYKTILRYVNDQHGTPFIVSPLAPNYFRIEFTGKNTVQLNWNAVDDPQELTSKPTGYIVYTAIGDADFDNGTYIRSKTSYELELEPNVLYHFKVTAVNRGGESFPTEVLSALYNPKAKKTVMVVNGFHRLSSPAIRNTPTEQGFDLDEDPGVTYGPTLGWVGRQINFDRKQMGNEDGGLGDSSEELAGRLIAGNDFNYVKTHAEAIASAGRYNIVSCSSEALETIIPSPARYPVIDLLLGLERDDKHSLQYYKTFTSTMRSTLQHYTSHGGSLLVSGAYVGCDMMSDAELLFMQNVLKCRYTGHNICGANSINGLGTTFQYWNQLNAEHYAAVSTDILQPVGQAYPAMQYADGQDAAIAYKGTDYSCFTMGFPFECITDTQKRSSIMRGLLSFLIK